MTGPITDEGKYDADLAKRWTEMEEEIRRLREQNELNNKRKAMLVDENAKLRNVALRLLEELDHFYAGTLSPYKNESLKKVLDEARRELGGEEKQ